MHTLSHPIHPPKSTIYVLHKLPNLARPFSQPRSRSTDADSRKLKEYQPMGTSARRAVDDGNEEDALIMKSCVC
jgi:hypothetical protein